VAKAQHGQVRSKGNLLLRTDLVLAFLGMAMPCSSSEAAGFLHSLFCLKRGDRELQAQSSCCLLVFQKYRLGRVPQSFTSDAMAQKQQPFDFSEILLTKAAA